MNNYFEQKKERLTNAKTEREFLAARYTPEQQYRIDDVAHTIATGIIAAQKEKTGVEDAHLKRVLHYACSHYISGFETDISTLMKQFEYYDVEVTGEKRDLLREALEQAELYRVEYENQATGNNEEVLEEMPTELIPGSTEDSTDDSLVATVQIPTPGSRVESKTTKQSVIDRWNEAEEKATETANLSAAEQSQRIMLSAAERWADAIKKAKERKLNDSSKFLER